MKKKSLDDLRTELQIYLLRGGCEDASDKLDRYEKEILKNRRLTFKHIGPFRVPDDIYNGCQSVVPKEVLLRYEQRLVHMLNTADVKEVNKIKNNITQQFIDLYEEWSNVNSEEARSHYN